MQLWKSTCGNFVKVVADGHETVLTMEQWSLVVANPIPYRIAPAPHVEVVR